MKIQENEKKKERTKVRKKYVLQSTNLLINSCKFFKALCLFTLAIGIIKIQDFYHIWSVQFLEEANIFNFYFAFSLTFKNKIRSP